MLEFCENIEVFSSETLGFGSVGSGANAPETFQTAVNEYSKSRESKTLQLESFLETGSGFFAFMWLRTSHHPDMDDKQNFYEPLIEISDMVINYGNLLCAGNTPATCETKTPNNTPMMYDRHHKSFEFSQYAGQKFAKQNPNFFQDLVTKE
ncbi:MAG: hypothetical protein ABJ275_03125 [Maricaulaceae bacterium]